MCAGIVLYNPEIPLLEENINSIYDQVECIYIINNHSTNALELCSLLKRYSKIVYEENSENMGIAFALNQLIYHADQANYSWILTLDQDSVCSSNMIDEYIKNILEDDIAIVCPYIINNNKLTLEEYQTLNTKEADVVTDCLSCITSGSLMNIKKVILVGGYNSSFFIDMVDAEINIRLLNEGYKIIRANKTYLIQQMGQGKELRFFKYLYQFTNIDIFRKMSVITVNSDMRLYYATRNGRYIRRNYDQYSHRLSLFFYGAIYIFFSVFYPLHRSRVKMWKNIINGFQDYRDIKDIQLCGYKKYRYSIEQIREM